MRNKRPTSTHLVPEEVQLLGLPQANVAGSITYFKADKRYQFLSYLAYQATWVSRDRLAYLFWPDVPTKNAKHRLRQLLKRVRKLKWLTNLDVEVSRIRWLVTTDIASLKLAIDKEDANKLLMLYQAPLLKAIETDENNEFHNWLVHEREQLYTKVRMTLLSYAKAEATQLSLKIYKTLLKLDPVDEEIMRIMLHKAIVLDEQEDVLNIYQDFCRNLERDIGLQPSSETEQLAIQVSKSNQQTKMGISILPQAHSSFIGRDLELAEVIHLLSQTHCHLLNLVGMGGIGKSRIALKTAQILAKHFSDGVVFIGLESLTQASHLASYIAKHLNLELSPQTPPLEQLKTYLSNKHSLIILDNFEHVSEGASLLSDLLATCPKLRLLLTSRERLNLEEEWLLSIEGLSYPKEGIKLPLQDIKLFEAIQLFVERAKRVRPQFKIHKDNAKAISKITQLVHGSPLGIELAAVWVRILPIEDIAKEIKFNIDFLASSSQNAKARHRSLRAIFEYSWQRLSATEKNALANLSIFVGGFTREAAATVTKVPLAVLAALVDKSLLSVTEQGRYNRHPLLHYYSQEKRLAKPQYPLALEQKHASYFLTLGEEAKNQLLGQREKNGLDRLHKERINIRSALAWAQEQDHVNTLRLANILMTLWQVTGEFNQTLSLVNTLKSKPQLNQQHAAYCEFLLLASHSHFVTGQFQDAKALAQESLELAKKHHHDKTIAESLMHLGHLAWRQEGKHETAKGFYKQSINHYQKIQDDSGKASGLAHLAKVLHEQSHYTQSLELFQQSLTLRKRFGTKGSIADSLAGIASVYSNLDEIDLARSHYQESLQLFTELGSLRNEALVLANLSLLSAKQADYPQAWSLGEKGLKLRRHINDKWGIAMSLKDLGNLAKDEGNYTLAREFQEESLALQRELNFHIGIGDSLKSLGDICLYERDLNAARDFYHESLTLRRNLKDSWGVVNSLNALAHLNLEENKLSDARVLFEESIVLAQEKKLKTFIAKALIGFTRLNIKMEPEKAAQLWGAAQTMLLTAKPDKNQMNITSTLKKVLGEDNYHLQYLQGSELSLDQAIALALKDAQEHTLH